MNTVPFAGLINSVVSKRENFEDTESRAWSITQTIIGIALGVFAGYVSWQSNYTLTEGGFDTLLRIVYAFFAFLFGLIYIIGKAILNPESREIIMRPFRVVMDRVRGTSSAYPETTY